MAFKMRGGGKTTAPKPVSRTPFVLGSRPQALKSPSIGIKPKAGQRDYGKPQPSGPFSGLGQGDTMDYNG